MTRPNRVAPDGRFVATPARGTLMGNRGILHDAQGQIGARRWAHKTWVCCALSFKNRHRKILTPGRYTELFFLDEAVALAAGHRPCAECRRADYLAFKAAWPHAAPRAADLDARLHAERAHPGARRLRQTHGATDQLPTGAFIRLAQTAYLLTAQGAHPFSPDGYGPPVPRPHSADILTPPSTLATLRAGYPVQIHASANLR